MSLSNTDLSLEAFTTWVKENFSQHWERSFNGRNNNSSNDCLTKHIQQSRNQSDSKGPKDLVWIIRSSHKYDLGQHRNLCCNQTFTYILVIQHSHNIKMLFKFCKKKKKATNGWLLSVCRRVQNNVFSCWCTVIGTCSFSDLYAGNLFICDCSWYKDENVQLEAGNAEVLPGKGKQKVWIDWIYTPEQF